MRLSIVTTLYYSAPYLEEFYRRVRAAAQQITDDFEIVFVNDGSPDDALTVAIAIFDRDPRVRIVDLSRNFGHHKAIMTGLEQARGELVFLIDCDLEEPPEALVEMFVEMRRCGSDVVYGVQRARKGGMIERVTGHLFYGLFNALSSYPVPQNITTARLMSQRYVRALVRHRDQVVFLAGLWAITGFTQTPIEVIKLSKGRTSYRLRHRLTLLLNSITSFSNRPLIGIFYLGCVILVVSGGAAALLIARRLFFGVLLDGWPSLIVSIWLLGGLTIFCIGVIGIYLAAIFMETKDRPYTVIRAVYDRTRDPYR